MKCVQPVEDWFHGHLGGASNAQYLLSLSCGAGSISFPMKFSLVPMDNKMEAQVPGLDESPLQSSSDSQQWCGTPAVLLANSPAWSHLKMELDLHAMMEEDSAPKCRRDLYLAFTHSAANEARDSSERHPDPPRVDVMPCDSDSLYEEADGELAASAPKAEDRNLARLIAKFDSSIEALWNPDDAADMPEELREEESEDHLTTSPVCLDVHGSKQNLFIACGTNITSSIWSSRPSPEDPPRDEWSLPPTVKWSEGDTSRCGDSLVVLNHNREDSSFTEVIPRPSHLHRDPPVLAPLPPPPAPSVEPAKEEEDLLTSARTHFIPIRQDPPTRQQHQSTCYADGTTFAIPNSLERLAFTRSESGALYLTEDDGLDSPRKYMEYKDKDSYDKSLDMIDSDSEDTMEFVPKFRVSQNEKFCQTDQVDEVDDEDSASKRRGTWSGLKSSCAAHDFYFPGDEQLSVEEEEAEVRDVMESKRCSKCTGPTWMPGWPTDWQEVQPSPQSWYQIWSAGNSAHNAVGGCWDCAQTAESHKSQLQRELSEDGEQLLSDLSSLLDQYGGVLSEINGNKRDHSDRMAEYTINYKIRKAGLLGSKQDSDWVMTERTINNGTAQKERKRRYSSSQRACSLFLEGSCRRPHCRFSHDMASIPCRFWADASCLKGGKCPFLHGGRPVTL